MGRRIETEAYMRDSSGYLLPIDPCGGEWRTPWSHQRFLVLKPELCTVGFSRPPRTGQWMEIDAIRADNQRAPVSLSMLAETGRGCASKSDPGSGFFMIAANGGRPPGRARQQR